MIIANVQTLSVVQIYKDLGLNCQLTNFVSQIDAQIDKTLGNLSYLIFHYIFQKTVLPQIGMETMAVYVICYSHFIKTLHSIILCTEEYNCWTKVKSILMKFIRAIKHLEDMVSYQKRQ